MSFVWNVGARCPVGLTALQVAMCARADLFAPRSTQVVDRRGDTIGCARLRSLADDLVGFDRFRALGAPALREAATGLPPDAGPVPVLLALPRAERPDQSARFDSELIDTIAHDAGLAVDLSRSRVLRTDGPGFAMLLDAAAALARDRAPAIVGAIDSAMHPEVLRRMDEERRVHNHIDEDAVIPSEGAAFALLGDAKLRADGSPLAEVLACRAAREEPGDTIGATFTRLCRDSVEQTAFGEGGPEAPRWVLNDLGGERVRRRAWNFASSRVDALGGATVERAPTLFGDLGAATGAMALAYLCKSWGARAPRPSRAMIVLQSEGPERATIVLRATRASARAGES